MIPILNLRALKRLPLGAVRVDRGTPFGNPYRIGPDGTREEVVARYEQDFLYRVEQDPVFRARVEALERASALLCWCAPLACHADVIAGYLARRAGDARGPGGLAGEARPAASSGSTRAKGIDWLKEGE